MRYFALILLSILMLSTHNWANDSLAKSSDGYQTLYFYQGFYDQDKKEWYFNQPKTLYSYKKDGKRKVKPLFQDDEVVFIVTYNDGGEIVRVLKVNYWVKRPAEIFRKPKDIFTVQHYKKNGKLKKKALYITKIGMKHLKKVEYFEDNNLSSTEYYKDGKIIHKIKNPQKRN